MVIIPYDEIFILIKEPEQKKLKKEIMKKEPEKAHIKAPETKLFVSFDG